MLGGTAIQIMIETLGHLAVSVEKLECQTHKCKISFVVTGKKATQRFLCTECLESLKHKDKKNRHIMDLRDYFESLKGLAMGETLREHPEECLQSENDKALDVTSRLTDDLNLSLGSIKSSLRTSYDELLVKLTTNASKCTDQTSSYLNKALKKNLFELSSIEKNLKIMKEGGSPTDIMKILDMAQSYISKKASPDNSLYDLLNDLNPLESAQSTHKRLTEFADRYMLRKRKVIKAVRAVVAKRFEKEESLICHLFSLRSNILKGMDDFLAATSDQAEKEKRARREFREKLEKARKTNKFGQRRPHKSTSRDKSIPNGPYLAKRKPETKTYDPRRSFESVFGKDKPLDELEKRYNVQRVEGAAIAHNRLTDVLNVRKTEMIRYRPNMKRIGLGNSDSRTKARKSFTHYRQECPLERAKKATMGTHLLQEETTNVLISKNLNTNKEQLTEMVKDLKLKEATESKLELQVTGKTSQKYLDYMAEMKKKELFSLKANASIKPIAVLKENNPVRSKSDLLEGAKGQIEQAMMEFSIKKLKVNDPRRKLIEGHNLRLAAATNAN